MPLLSSKCSTVASILALATLPGDDALRDTPIQHPDFIASAGHIRRVIDGAVCHGVDWDGLPGVDTIVREHGRRSGPLWREFRAWREQMGSPDLKLAGDIACALLTKHFGEYHEATAEALRQRRALQRERIELSRKLDAEFSPLLRRAAREYLSPQLAYSLKLPTPDVFIAASLSSPETHFPPNLPPTVVSAGTTDTSSYVRSLMLLQDHQSKNFPLPSSTDLDDTAREILARVEPVENMLTVLDVKLALATLPPIPGEDRPADMDRLAYGSLICRHRAVIVGVLLAETGYDIRLVEGTVARGNLPGGGHLFLYSPTEGILEPSAEGPHFWQQPLKESVRDGIREILVEGDLLYTFNREVIL